MNKKNGPQEQARTAIIAAGNRPIALVVGVGAVGSAIARLLMRARQGYHVVLAARSGANIEPLVAEFVRVGRGARVSTLIMNAVNREQLLVVRDEFRTAGKHIAVLVLAAGHVTFDPEHGVPNYDANEESVRFSKTRPLHEWEGLFDGLIAVSSIVADFKHDDPRLTRQIAYQRATQHLEQDLAEAQRNYQTTSPALASRWVVWRCPLVRGSTAEAYKAAGIVPQEQHVPDAIEAVAASLVSQLIAVGLYN